MKRDVIIKELCSYKEYEESVLNSLSDDELNIVFNKHCAKYAQSVKASDVHKIDGTVLIDTPDGYQPIGDYWIKNNKEIYSVKVNNTITKVSGDHLFQTQEGWVMARDLTHKHCILTKNGFRDVQYVRKHKNNEATYDWEVMHENHRYWTASGLSSHNTGKTFLLLNMCREAQKMGYFIIYYDSENAVDADLAENFGIDLDMFRYEPVSTVQEFRSNVTNIIDSLIDKKENGLKIPKILIALDSAGNLASQKEIDDAKAYTDKADMSRAKMMKSVFRIMMSKLGIIGGTFIFSNHIYKTLDLYSQDVQAGGQGLVYGASIILNMTKAKLKEGTEQTGIVVTAKPQKNRFCVPTVVKFHISYQKGMNPYVGLQEYMSWDACGVGRGKFITAKEYAKLNDNDKAECRQHPLDENIYFQPSDKGHYICTDHRVEPFKWAEVCSKGVWTDEALRRLDENVIKGIFSYSDHTSETEISDMFSEDEDDTNDYIKTQLDD